MKLKVEREGGEGGRRAGRDSVAASVPVRVTSNL